MLTENNIKDVTIKIIEPALARNISQTINATLSDPKASVNDSAGTLDRLSFVACLGDEYIGIITLEFPYPNNANIYWLAVATQYHKQHVGKKLVAAAENYCRTEGYSSLTVEVMFQNKENYSFYEASGFKPLFATQHTIYLQKTVGFADFVFIDLTHTLSPDVPHWGVDVGFKYNARLIQTAEAPGNVKFRVQRLEMSAGIGTHMDAPSHCYETAASISDIPLHALITVCKVIDVSDHVHDRYSVTADDVRAFEEKYGTIPDGAFVIIYTGWDQRWAQADKYRNEKIFPNISVEAAKLLLMRNIVGIGIDTLSPDAFGSDFPVHELLLSAGKYIIENVANAKQLDPADSFVFALPMKILDGTEAPVRLVGMCRKK